MQPLDVGDPRTIGHYRLLRRLGSGGMGRVYLGRSPGGRTVAVKVVHPHFAVNEEFRARFRREVDSARRVGGSWTAPVLDADPDAEVPWVATGYVAGPTLHAAVATHGPLPESCVRAVGAGLAEALAAVHGLGLVHRDIKPSNVMLTLDGPRLIDFGISRATDGTSVVTSAGVAVGSPGYMSPEQVLGKGAVGPPSDVFSLGAVLGYAATGGSPFPGDSSAALLYKVVHEDPELDGLRGRLRELVDGCLVKEPADRPTPVALVEGLAGEAGASGLIRTGWLPGSLVEQVSRNAVELLHLEPDADGSGETPSGLVPFTRGSRSPGSDPGGAAEPRAAAGGSAASGAAYSEGGARTEAGEEPSAAGKWPAPGPPRVGESGFGPPDPSYGAVGSPAAAAVPTGGAEARPASGNSGEAPPNQGAPAQPDPNQPSWNQPDPNQPSPNQAEAVPSAPERPAAHQHQQVPRQPDHPGARSGLSVSASSAQRGATGTRGTRARQLSCTLVLSVAGLLVAALVTSTFVFDLLPGGEQNSGEHGDQPPASSEQPPTSGGSGGEPSDRESSGEVTSVPAKFVGTWRGDLRMDSGLPAGELTITIKKGGVGDRIATGDTVLASLKCSGAWTLTSATERKLVTEGSAPGDQKGCSDGGGGEVFTLRHDGSLRYESNDDPAGNAEGTLHKVD